jgi:hypothetical protein
MCFSVASEGSFSPEKKATKKERQQEQQKKRTLSSNSNTVQKHGTDRTTETTLGLRHVCHSTTLVGLAVASAPALDPFGHRHAKFYAQ